MIPSGSSFRAGRGQKTHTESCPRLRPDAATATMPSGSSRTASSRNNPSSCCALHSLRRRRVRRVGMSPLSRPTRHPSSDPEHFSSGLPLHVRPLQKCSPKISRVLPLHRSGMLSDDSDPNRHRDPLSADDSPFLSPSRNPIRYAPASCPQAFQLHRCRLRRQRSTSNACPTMYRP